MIKNTLTSNTKALVVFSGGQDSTTCIAWAQKKFKNISLINFNYQQRHKIEINCARQIAKLLELDIKEVKLDLFKQLTENALLNKNTKIKKQGKTGLPNTFVDGRNLIFLSLAAIHAKKLGIHHLITGTCETDYSGYPDCRAEFIKSLEKTLSLAMDYPFKIHTPLMHLTKKETVELMKKLGKLDLLSYTHTCYEGLRPACGQCPACKLRLKGFKEANLKDPLPYANI